MATLTTKGRKAIPTSKFAGPDRSYPIEDKAHARNALARAAQQKNAGNLSAEQAATISSRARKMLGGKPHHHDNV